MAIIICKQVLCKVSNFIQCLEILIGFFMLGTLQDLFSIIMIVYAFLCGLNTYSTQLLISELQSIVPLIFVQKMEKENHFQWVIQTTQLGSSFRRQVQGDDKLSYSFPLPTPSNGVKHSSNTWKFTGDTQRTSNGQRCYGEGIFVTINSIFLLLLLFPNYLNYLNYLNLNYLFKLFKCLNNCVAEEIEGHIKANPCHKQCSL